MITPGWAPGQGQPSDRFPLIEALLEVRVNLLRIEKQFGIDTEEGYEHVHRQMSQVWRIGRAWARFDPVGIEPRIPSILSDVPACTDDLGQSVATVFRDGYDFANASACVFPRPRPRDERPEVVWVKNVHFWVAPCARGLRVVSKNVAGGFGHVVLTPRVAKRVFSLLTQNAPNNAAYWFNADPYGMDAPTQVLLRDDRAAGWDGECDDLGRPHASASETLGELFLQVDHPGAGELYFGVVGQEQEQVASFLALQPEVERWFAEAQSPERRAEAEARARIIRGQAEPCFLSPSGYCEGCEADVTLLLERSVGRSITGCPACMKTWCD